MPWMLVRLEFRPRARDDRQLVMRIDRRARVAGKMLAATEDSLRAHRPGESARIPHHLVRIDAPGAVLERVVDIVRKRHVEHRAEVKVEAEQAQDFAREPAMPFDERQVAPLAQLLRARRFGAAFLQARDAAAFLVDSQHRAVPHLAAQIVDQPAQLRGLPDVPPKQDEAGRLHLADDGGGRRVQLEARHAHDDVFSATHPAISAKLHVGFKRRFATMPAYADLRVRVRQVQKGFRDFSVDEG
jgi:hypothetical protein